VISGGPDITLTVVVIAVSATPRNGCTRRDAEAAPAMGADHVLGEDGDCCNGGSCRDDLREVEKGRLGDQSFLNDPRCGLKMVVKHTRSVAITAYCSKLVLVRTPYIAMASHLRTLRLSQPPSNNSDQIGRVLSHGFGGAVKTLRALGQPRPTTF
jgi:hypothetical protein